MTRQQGRSFHAAETEEALLAWAAGLAELRSAKLGRFEARCNFRDVVAIVEVDKNRKISELNYTGYISLYNAEFERLVYGVRTRYPHGKDAVIGCTSGLVSPPYLENSLSSRDAGAVSAFFAKLALDATEFLEVVHSMEAALKEFTSNESKLKYSDPRGAPKRALFAGVVSYLLGRDWMHFFATARLSRVSGFVEWVNAVESRIASSPGGDSGIR